jgi:uncharacterized protein (TIGR00730 family)
MNPDHPVSENLETHEIVDSALQDLWRVANGLARIRPPGDRFRVTVFGSARIRPEDPLYAQVRDLARDLSALGCDVITGGGPGLMQAANEGAQAGDPEDKLRSVGIRIGLPFEQGANPFVEKLYTHETFFTRLHQFIRLSDAYVVVPGGIGTTLETLMVWQLLQVEHLQGIPLVTIGPMWRELVGWATRNMAEGELHLASPEDMHLPTCVDTPAEAVAAVAACRRSWAERRATP